MRVIRLSDMVDLANDARFEEIRTPQVDSGEAANISVAYNLSQFLLSDNGNYTCEVISMEGNVTAEAVIVAGRYF